MDIMRNVFNYLTGPPPQRDILLEEKKAEVKKRLMEVISEASDIDAFLIEFSSHGIITVMQGGLQDDFEAGVFLRRAEFLINLHGLVK